MKRTILILMSFCFLAGCLESMEQDDSSKTKKRTYKGLPVEVVARSDKGLPVEVITGKDKGLPVRLDVNGGTAVPVRLDMSEDKSLPVQLKLSQKSLIFIAIAGGIILLIAVASCFSAIISARSARAISKSIEKTQQRQEARRFDGENG
jgi:hypothetical protein